MTWLTGALRELCISKVLGPAGFVSSPVLQMDWGCGAGLDMAVEDE